MSYRMQINPKSRRAARFIASVHKGLQQSFLRASKQGLTQQKMAAALELDRSTINKRLLGHANLTLRSISDMAWAMDHTVRIVFDPVHDSGNFWHSRVPVSVTDTPRTFVSAGNSAPPTTSARKALNNGKIVVSDEYA